MITSLAYRVNRSMSRFNGWFAGIERCPRIRWDNVVRIEALGTDAIGAFAVTVTFIYLDGCEVMIIPEMQGYYEIIESLDERYPSLSPDWYQRMSMQPWHVESVLYSRDDEMVRVAGR